MIRQIPISKQGIEETEKNKKNDISGRLNTRSYGVKKKSPNHILINIFQDLTNNKKNNVDHIILGILTEVELV